MKLNRRALLIRADALVDAVEGQDRSAPPDRHRDEDWPVFRLSSRTSGADRRQGTTPLAEGGSPC
ncbi:hypothetical protein ACI78V_06130 [Geodermatophilus sp. SYSU D00742]